MAGLMPNSISKSLDVPPISHGAVLIPTVSNLKHLCQNYLRLVRDTIQTVTLKQNQGLHLFYVCVMYKHCHMLQEPLYCWEVKTTLKSILFSLCHETTAIYFSLSFLRPRGAEFPKSQGDLRCTLNVSLWSVSVLQCGETNSDIYAPHLLTQEYEVPYRTLLFPGGETYNLNITFMQFIKARCKSLKWFLCAAW